jgi:hypothetical protein
MCRMAAARGLPAMLAVALPAVPSMPGDSAESSAPPGSSWLLTRPSLCSAALRDTALSASSLCSCCSSLGRSITNTIDSTATSCPSSRHSTPASCSPRLVSAMAAHARSSLCVGAMQSCSSGRPCAAHAAPDAHAHRHCSAAPGPGTHRQVEVLPSCRFVQDLPPAVQVGGHGERQVCDVKAPTCDLDAVEHRADVGAQRQRQEREGCLKRQHAGQQPQSCAGLVLGRQACMSSIKKQSVSGAMAVRQIRHALVTQSAQGVLSRQGSGQDGPATHQRRHPAARPSAPWPPA